MRVLVNYGLDPDTRNQAGETPLHLMAANGRLPETIGLLEAGAGANVADRRGRTALHHLMTPGTSPRDGRNESFAAGTLGIVLAVLLDNGADLRRTDAEGNTPLHLLLALNEIRRDTLLLTLKTNTHFRAALRIKNKAGDSPMQLALGQLFARPSAAAGQLVNTLLAPGAELPTPEELGGSDFLHKLAAINPDASFPPGFPSLPAGWPDPDRAAAQFATRVFTNLLARVTKVDTRDAQQQTPLHVAVRSQNATFASALLARGANVNAQDAAGDTPLHLALRGRNAAFPAPLPLVSMLLSNQCDIARLNAAGESPLRLELLGRMLPPALFLPPGATKDFFAAAKTGDLASLDAYLKLDTSLATLTDPFTKVSPLRSAALTGQTEVAERLRRAGATDPASAALLGWTNTLATMLHTQPDLGATFGLSGIPLLHSAASRGQLAAAELLLTSAVSASLTDLWGRTALYHAATNGSTEVAKWLGARGVRHTIFDAVALGDQQTLAALLTTEPASVKASNRMAIPVLLSAVQRGEQAIVSRLLSAGADPNQPAGGLRLSPLGSFIAGSVPLHLAAYSNRLDLAEPLVRAGARVEESNSMGCAALHFAAARGHVEFAAWLLERGANPNAFAGGSNSVGHVPLPPHLRSAGWLPLHLAVRHGHLKMIELLVAKGAKLDATDAAGRTAADLLQSAGFGMPAWPPSPFATQVPTGPFSDVTRDPHLAAQVTETLRKLGAVIPSNTGPAFINRGPPIGFPPTGLPPRPGFPPAPARP